MKNWKFIKVGNGIEISGVAGKLPPDSEISKTIYEELKKNNYDKDKTVLSLSIKYKVIPNARMFFEDAVEKVIKSYNNRTINESINKQVWSMFKGLTKDAEKEVVNEGNTVKISLFKSPANHSWIPGINDHMIEGAPEFKGAWGKDEALKWTKEWAEKHGLKVGNARPKEQLLADVRELTKYIKDHPGQDCEKEKRLLGEAKEELDKNYGVIIGNAGRWNATKTMYGKWDDTTGRPAEEYARITWLGEGKGGLVNIWKGHQMTSEKYGSNDLEDLRRWAEQRIGNETLGQWAKAKPRVINDESTRMRNEYNAEIQRLTKKAEEEVGNELPTEQDLKNWIRMSQQDMKEAQREMEKNKPLGHPDSYREENYGRAKVKYDEAAKAIKKMEEELRQGKYKEVGNFKTGKSKLSVGDKVSLYGVKGTVKGITGENSDNIYGEPVIEFESEDGKTKQVPEHYLVKVGNKAIVLKDGNVWVVLYANETKSQEFESEAEAREFAKKVGNADTVSEYNAEIQRLTKKAEQLRRMGQGRSAMEIEKQIEKLGRELRELGNKKTGNKVIAGDYYDVVMSGSHFYIYKNGGSQIIGPFNSEQEAQKKIDAIEKERQKTGNAIPGSIASIGPAWMYGGTVYGKMDTDESGKKHNEYVKITWLGSDKGGVANYFIDDKMQSDKFGSLDKNELKRWAEQKIGNETLCQWEKAKPRIINNLQRARNAMTKNQKITLWKGNDTVYISEDGTVQYLENNAFETDRDKFESQEKAIEELTKQGYRKK